MPKHRTLTLTEEQREELIASRDHGKPAYLRERCAALLKIAEGAKAAFVARNALLKPHEPDTIYRWLDAYQAHGISGLRIASGRGRKPAFSPSVLKGGRSAKRPAARGAS